MLNLIKGMGKAYKEAQKAKKLDKAAKDKLPPEYGGPPRDPEVIKLNKQLKIAKNVGIGTASPAHLLHIFADNSSEEPLLKVENDGTGDASIRFHLTGAENYTMGIDNNDSNKFKIAKSTALSSTPRLTIDSSGTKDTTFKKALEGNGHIIQNTLSVSDGGEISLYSESDKIFINPTTFQVTSTGTIIPNTYVQGVSNKPSKTYSNQNTISNGAGEGLKITYDWFIDNN